MGHLLGRRPLTLLKDAQPRLDVLAEFVGLGAQQPYQQGVTEADIAGGSLIGKKAPAYVALNALPVDHSNVLDAWKQVYNTDPPADLQKAFVK